MKTQDQQTAILKKNGNILMAIAVLLAVSVLLQLISLGNPFTDNVASTGDVGPTEKQQMQTPMPVTITNRSLPVDVDNWEVDVKLRNHSIIDIDPIPVRIVR